MKRKVAGLIFLGVCLLLALLLIAKVITPILSSGLFALALVTLGLASNDFKK